MKQLRIAPGLALPLDAVTSTLIAYGGKGMGKTNLGSVLVEELARCGLRWSWLDPLGVSWGLRHSADGAGPGVECLILGGLHGDVPIEPAGGAAVADVVVEESTNVLIDFSRKPSGEMWSIGEKIRFVTAYALRLFQRQGEIVSGRRRDPIFQVLDEAARYIPQIIPSGAKELAESVGAWNQLVEEGRNVGIGVGLLTQRSARMAKSVSKLADAMIAFRTVGPNSLTAILDWLGEHVEKERIKDLAATVRSLDRGQALVVSPGWLKFEGVVKVRMRETFDSSATVKHGERTRTARGEGAKPDIAKIRERMAAFVEKAKAEDPRELRKTIAELRQKVSALEKGKPAPPAPKAPRVVEKPVVRDAQIKRLEAAIRAAAKIADETLRAASDRVAAAAADLKVALGKATAPAAPAPPMGRGIAALIPDRPVSRPAPVAARPPRSPRVNEEPSGVTPAQQRILDALAWLESVGLRSANRTQLALLADQSPTSSSYANNLGALRSAGLVDYGAGSTVFLSEKGRSAANETDEQPTSESIQRSIISRLSPAKARILQALIDAYPAGLTRPELAARSEQSATSSSFANNLGSLRSLGVIDYRVGEVVALPVLFVERA